MFPSEKMKEKVNEIIIVIDDLSRRLPVLAVRNISIDDNEFYGGMTYSEFANWICDNSKEMTQILLSGKSTYIDINYDEQRLALIRLFDVLTVLWWKCYPGIASEQNIVTLDGKKTSMAGMVFKTISQNMKDVGYPEFKFAFE